MARIIEHIAEHYDVQEAEFGRVYVWCPEGIVVECECGEKLSIKRSDLINNTAATCECGKDQTSSIREAVQDEVSGHLFEDDEAVHPWRYWHTSEDTGIPF